MRVPTRFVQLMRVSGALLIAVALMLPAAATLDAQTAGPGGVTGVTLRPRPRGFGDRWPLMFTWTRNKVNWWNLNWRITPLENSTLYFYDRAEPAARMARTMLETNNRRILGRLNYNLQEFTQDKTIPTVIYTSHHTFEQTNTITQSIPEGLGGFTEFIKGRVVFPYTGGNADFFHVLEHENAHIHMIHKLKHVFKARRIYDTSKLLPTLWFSEGFAELQSVGYSPSADTYRLDRETEMFLRDAVLTGDMPTLKEMRLYPNWARVYKFGHAFDQYLVAQYGADHFHGLFDHWHHLFPNRNSYALLKRRKLDSFDLLNPGVGYLEPAFVRVDGENVPVEETDRGWRARLGIGLVDSLDGRSVGDLVASVENIQLDGIWWRITEDTNGNLGLYNPDQGLKTTWNGGSVHDLVRTAKKDYEDEAYKLMSFDRLLEWWFSATLKDLTSMWHEDVAGYYSPWLEGRLRVEKLRPVGAAATELWPTASRDGRIVLYKAYREDFAYTLMALDLATGHSVRLARDNSPEIESIHALAEGGDIWPLGDDRYRVVFSAKQRHRDVVFVQDLERRPDGRLDLVGGRSMAFDPAPSDLVGIFGVRFVDGPDRLVLSGLRLTGFHDLYLVDLRQGRIERQLTDDLATDRMPVYWDGRIIFASDRASDAETFAYHLFSLDLASGRIVQITDGPGNEKNPSVSLDGRRIFFESDASGVSNIYEWDGLGAPRRLTDVATGVFTPAQVSADTLLVAGFHDQEYNLYLVPISEMSVGNGALPDASFHVGAVPLTPDALAYADRAWDQNRIAVADQMATRPLDNVRTYSPSFSLDDFYASSEFGGYQTYNAAVFGTAVRFSDILGEHQIAGALWNGPREGLSDLSWVVSYWNQKNRMKWGGSLYRTSGIYYNLVRQDFYIRDRGGVNFQFNVPFNAFSDLDLIVGTATERRSLGTITGSVQFDELEFGIGYTRDVSTWGTQGPHRGWVFSIFYDHILSVSDKFSTFSNYVVGDVRAYYPLHRRVVAAARLAGGHSEGTEPEFFFLGGGFFLRGYWNLSMAHPTCWPTPSCACRFSR